MAHEDRLSFFFFFLSTFLFVFVSFFPFVHRMAIGRRTCNTRGYLMLELDNRDYRATIRLIYMARVWTTVRENSAGG